jgi:hypothetical protein
MAIVNTRQQPPSIPLMPTGSLIKTNSKFGHELIAGPMVNNQQTVLHKEQGIGIHMEPIEAAAKRYNFTGFTPPVNLQHGMESWSRMTQQVGRPWAALDNCQHAARFAYYGVADSPAVNTATVLGVVLLIWLGSQD